MLKLKELQKEKLDQAKKLLFALGMPPQQCNDRSGWVLLALANVKPEEPIPTM